MENKDFDLSAQSAACIFGIGWFFPYSAYTLWAYGIHPVDLGTVSNLLGDTFSSVWGIVLAHPIEMTMLSQLGIGCLFITGSRKLSWSTIGFRRTSAIWFFVALAGILSGYVFSGLLQAIFQAPGNEGIAAEVSVQQSAAHPIGQILGVLLTMGLATAVIEEVAFRGVLYRYLRTNMGPIAGVALSALIFSLFHLRFINPGGLLGIGATLQVMFGGIVLAFLFEKSGSLWPSIYLHCVNNVIGILQVIAPR
jgi:membrane protease YdiL (CAAX protease family)